MKFASYALIASLSLASFASQAHAEGHMVYAKVIGSDIAAMSTSAGKKVSSMMESDKAAVVAAESADLMTKRQMLAQAQTELSNLKNQLGSALVKQDTVAVVALSSTALFSTATLGRIAMEMNEKMIAATEYVVPDMKGLGFLNNMLRKIVKFGDGLGKKTGKVNLIFGFTASAGTAYLFYCEHQDVERLAAATSIALADVEKKMAEIDFIENAPVKK